MGSGDSPVPCASCGGTGGHMEETTEEINGVVVYRKTWYTCQTCGGCGYSV